MEEQICAGSGPTHFVEPERVKRNPRVKFCLKCAPRLYKDRKEYSDRKQAEFRRKKPQYNTKYVQAHRRRKAEARQNGNQS